MRRWEEADKDAGLSGWPDDTNVQPCTIEPRSSSAVPLLRQSSTSNHRRPNAATESSRDATTRPLKAVQQGSSSLPAQSSYQSKSFEFVLVTDNESRRQVRRHAMRQYMHQRRLDSIARLGAPRVPVSGWTTRTTPGSPTPLNPSVEKLDNVADEVTVKLEKGSPPSDEDRYTGDTGGKLPYAVRPKSQKVKREEDAALPLVVKPKYSNPRVFPEQRVFGDPFSTYPVPTSEGDQELIQHFVVTYPSMMYKFTSSAANNLNPMLDIFRKLALHEDLPFQAMLAIASKHRAAVEGKTESVQSLTHKMRTLRLINERIHMDSKGQDDGVIYAIATMAVIEKWSKDTSIERMHFRGLASMIRNRGGMKTMRASSPFLEKVLYWVDFSCASKAIVGTALPWTGTIPDTPPPGFDFINPDMHLGIPHNSTAPENTETLCDQFRACEDFLRFFRLLHELERNALNSGSGLASTTTAPRHKSFTSGTKLHTILTLLPDHDRGIRDIRFIDEYTCMSCLFFLAVALYHCYSTSSSFDEYLHWLDNEIQSLSPFENPSITSILWLLLQNGGFPPASTVQENTNNSDSSSNSNSPTDSGARCWVVSRMVRIAKHLEWKRQGKIWDTLRQVLIDFILTQQDCALDSEHVDADAFYARERKRGSSRCYFWDEDELRREILDIQDYGSGGSSV
ncbi:hypothetical protein ARAM_005151 [Aspergillus rambellii]|uniref:Transcription factor domain-containing protein n=1 Tax=Aspergillus rambellii TaxID=308745 RepID=A0A0F8V4G1_9EURO|nr:hypothetical protein ARAM_005151 [Aspergillus rambellii]